MVTLSFSSPYEIPALGFFIKWAVLSELVPVAKNTRLIPSLPALLITQIRGKPSSFIDASDRTSHLSSSAAAFSSIAAIYIPPFQCLAVFQTADILKTIL